VRPHASGYRQCLLLTRLGRFLRTFRGSYPACEGEPELSALAGRENEALRVALRGWRWTPTSAPAKARLQLQLPEVVAELLGHSGPLEGKGDCRLHETRRVARVVAVAGELVPIESALAS
jgi:hypothetical protein